MSEPKAPHVFDYVEYDLGKERDGNSEERIIWNRIYILKIEGNVEFRKDPAEKWMDLTLFRAIDISPDHHTHFYLKNSVQSGKKLIVAIGRAFYAEPSLSGSVLLMDSSYIVINPATKENFKNEPENYLASGARTANGNTQASPLNTDFEEVLIFFLNITAVSGTNPTLDLYIDIQDPLSGNWVNQDKFPQVTATGISALSVYCRSNRYSLRWVLEGTTPSFTFSVGVAKVK